MASTTVDLLLNMQEKTPPNSPIKKQMKDLESEGKKLSVELAKVPAALKDSGHAQQLRQRIDEIKKSQQSLNNEAKKQNLAEGFKRAEDSANKLAATMSKVRSAGVQAAAIGGAMVAPFVLALNKYVETAKETEPTAKRIAELQGKWADAQVRVGRVTANIVLPALEKALEVVDKIAAYAEKNPEAVKAIGGIGASLVVLGGIVATVAQVIGTVSTAVGIVSKIAGLGVSAGVTGGAGAASGIGAALSSAISAAAPILAIAASVALAAELTRRLMNWVLGTNQTWADIGTTVKQLAFITAEGWKLVPSIVGKIVKDLTIQFVQLVVNIRNIIYTAASNVAASLGRMIYDALKSVGDGISSVFGKLGQALTGIPHRASGGYIGQGLFVGGERGREFVLSNATTRRAESIIGGQLSQAQLINALAGGRGVNATINDNRRFMADTSISVRREIARETQAQIRGIVGMIGG